MIRAILIDDEPQNLEYISNLIEMYNLAVEIIGKYTDPEKGLDAILQDSPDVVLLDIEMPGMTGLELLQRLPTVNFEVIFITAYNQYALNAIKLSAIDYLLKPVEPEELEVALKKAEEQTKLKQTTERLEVLIKLMEKDKGEKYNQDQRVSLPTFEGMSYVKMKNIIHIEAGGSYCHFHIEDKGSMTISKNIGNYEEALSGYGFMRVHRGHIANLHHVTDFFRQDGGVILMSDGCKLPVSGGRRDGLLNGLEGI